jgi:hypothetical protein
MKKINAILILIVTFNLYIFWDSLRKFQLNIHENEHFTIPSESYTVNLPVVSKILPEYFVSPNGNDSNPGTLLLPWRTVKKAAQTVSAGYTIYLRGGSYNEAVSFYTSGTESNPIRIMAYPGENPVFDGDHSFPGSGGYLLSLRGNYLYVSGVEVRNSAYGGIYVYGNYDVVDNVYVHHGKGPGVIISHGYHSIVENSRIWRNGLINEYGQASSSTGLSAARNGVSFATIRHNTVWENWGEGISSFEANQVIIEDNISHDNWSTNIYISDSTNILCQRNFVYMSPGSYIFFNGSYMGIMMGDEKYTPPSANITIINNIAYGNMKNLSWFQGVQGGGMNNVLIANNTFVNSLSNDMGHRNVDIGSGSHQNVRFFNNVILQENSLPIEDITDNPQVVLSNNLWSQSPRAIILGTGDIVADPLLQHTGGPFTPDWFRLTSLSPAINKALKLPEVLVDYFNTLRDAYPDIGAIEFTP